MRTFVIADAHGHPETIHAALRNGDFRPGSDRLIFAGDFLDRGTRAQACLDLIERYADEVLLGNHDLAVLLDTPVWPQEPDSPGFRPLLLRRVLNGDPADAWKAVTAVEGVLVSHAGISARYQRVFSDSCRAEPSLFAELMNAAFRTTVRAWVDGGDGDGEAAGDPAGSDEDGSGAGPWRAEGGDPAGNSVELDLFGDYGPFWFRPPPFTRVRPLPGVTQVAGHTPVITELAGSTFHMIDPAVWLTDFGEPLTFRYAIIENGRVRVEEGQVEQGWDE